MFTFPYIVNTSLKAHPIDDTHCSSSLRCLDYSIKLKQKAEN